MSLTIQQINSAIITQSWTNDNLNAMIAAIKYARTQLGKDAIRAIKVGSNVNFTNSKTGRNVTGVVTKVAIKYVTVKTIDGLWRVPASMLTVVAEEAEYA